MHADAHKLLWDALDFHVAFCMGRLLEAHRSNGIAAPFGVISRDGGFEPLLRHVRSLGYAAKQAGSIREVLDFAPRIARQSASPWNGTFPPCSVAK